MAVKGKDLKDKHKKVKLEVDLKTKKARLLKLRLAGTGLPRNFDEPTQMDRRNKIQSTKKTVQGIELPKKGPMAQRRVRQEVNFINSGTKITPTRTDRKINPTLKKRLAKLKLAKEHGHSIVFKGNPIGLYRAASLQGQQGKYAKYWLLNAKQTNGNGWGIASHTAKENMKKFIGRPLVVTSSKWHGASVYGERYEHPYLPTDDLNQIFAHQEQFRVGSIIDIGEKNGDYYATIEMLPKFANYNLPPFCSPAIYQLDAKEHEGQISKWEALHLAALDENPAYGARIALLKGTCVGTSNECKVQFKSAKLQEASIVCTKNVKSKLSQLKKNQKIAIERGIALADGITKKGGVKATGRRRIKRKATEHRKEFLNKAIGTKLQEDRPASKATVMKSSAKDRLIKVRNKIASLGEQNMTFQKSKKIKIHKKKHPEVRKAKKSVEDILRGMGRSIDGSHDQSTFLSPQGDFIGGGVNKGDTHLQQILNATGSNKQAPMDGDSIINDFITKNKLPRVQTFPIDRSGTKKTSIHINSPINKNQLKSIRELEKGGRNIGFLVGDKTGEGSRDLISTLRERKFLQ